MTDQCEREADGRVDNDDNDCFCIAGVSSRFALPLTPRLRS